jgi:hypothetical protein
MKHTKLGQIEVKVAETHQLFNSMDPSPFHERDLDREAEQFILTYAQEFSRHASLKLLVHLGQTPPGVNDTAAILSDAFHHHFKYRAELKRRELLQLFREGRIALGVGLVFLAICEMAAQALPATQDTWHGLLRQGLAIVGWVAMWRPLEIYLYLWWPMLSLKQRYLQLSQMEVEVKTPT